MIVHCQARHRRWSDVGSTSTEVYLEAPSTPHDRDEESDKRSDEANDVDDDQVPTRRMGEIPTLPSAIALQIVPDFDSQAERFFSSTPPDALDTGAIMAGYALDEEIAAWWVGQRRRSLSRWVAGIMAMCVALLAFGVR